MTLLPRFRRCGMRDGYWIEVATVNGWRPVGFYGINEPAAIDSARWYARLCRKRHQYRVCLRTGGLLAVIHG
ncbi:hypothetical protein ACTJIL_04820 [Luteimonas sp. 22616]|uniref:hypothetical protein n=1 Tax=Luteimonas sp. 22616 TaxID=3453951 RepID=UPI003F869BB4